MARNQPPDEPRRGFLRGLMGAAGVFTAGMASAKTAAERREEPRKDIAEIGAGMKAVQVRDVSWAYRDKGKGPVALFLHPFFLNSAFWLDQLNELGDIRRCLAPDMRGWGRSEPVTDSKMDLYQYARDVLAFMDAVDIDTPVDLVGMSVGAFISGLVYEMAPDRVASLTLISSSFDFERNLPNERYQREMARIAVVEGRDTMFRRFDEYIDGPDSTLHVRARYKQMLLEARTEMLVAQLMGSGSTPPRPDLPGKVKVPVLIPAGTQDSVISMEAFKKSASAFPNATVVPVEGAGRLVPLEAPGEFNAVLRRFWA